MPSESPGAHHAGLPDSAGGPTVLGSNSGHGDATTVGDGGSGVDRLSAEGFEREFRGAWTRLWCIAAAVTRDRGRAEDVVQEAAVIALQKIHEFDPRTSFAAWMGQIVRFTALNESRRIQRDRPGLTDPVVMDESHGARGAGGGTGTRRGVTSAGAILAGQQEFDDDVVKALNQLDEVPRACVLMKTVLELSYREISLSLDIPEGTAMSHVHRGRKALRQALAGRLAGGGKAGASA